MELGLPRKREQGLVVQEMPGETLVYDMDTNKAHCLNEPAARVWNACDGKSTHQDISENSQTEIGVTLQTLNVLREHKLLVE